MTRSRNIFLGILVLPGLLVALSCATGPAQQEDEPAPPDRGSVAVAPEATQDRHPSVDYSISCQDCHRQNDPQIVQDWEGSLHGQQDVGCYVCHGDGTVHFEARPGDENCAACHSATIADLQHAPVDRCFSCHDSHRLTFH